MSSPVPSPGDLAGSRREAVAEFLLGLRAKGVRDLAVLRALEAAPREHFVSRRYADLAARDLALPIACGQTMSEPFVIARMLEALALTPGSRVLEIGAGSGYTTALLARLSLEVLSIERYQGLVTQARTRLEALGLGNAAVVWGDGLAVPPGAEAFDRLLIHGVVQEMPSTLIDRVSADGVVVYAKLLPVGGTMRQHLVRAVRTEAGEWVEAPVCRSRLRALEQGVSQAL